METETRYIVTQPVSVVVHTVTVQFLTSLYSERILYADDVFLLLIYYDLQQIKMTDSTIDR